MAYPNQLPPTPQNVGSTNTIFLTELRFDPSYFRTPAGIFKVAVIILNFLGYICVQTSAFWSNVRGIYFIIVAQIGFWFSGVLLLMYLYHMVEKYHNIKWLKIEMLGYAGITFLYLIASTIAVSFGSIAYSAAGFFGYLAMVLYALDAFFKAQALQAGDLAQGTRVNTKPTHVVTPPALP